MDALALVKATSAKLNKVGAVVYFDPVTLERGKEMGLDGFRFYFLGRGGVLGDAPASVVASAFGYFHASLLGRMWESAKERVKPQEAARAYLECNAEIGRRKLGDGRVDVGVLDAFSDAAAAVVAAADPAGLTLYSGFVAQPVPDDGPGRAMHMAVLLRELRGSIHLLAVVANGLSAVKAHAIKRPDDLANFGYDEAPTTTEDDRAKLDAAEAMTDEIMASSFATLDADAGVALLAGTDALYTMLIEAS